ncbi:MAG: DUF222 domain-containing protein [Ornithinimicrobium sp.]
MFDIRNRGAVGTGADDLESHFRSRDASPENDSAGASSEEPRDGLKAAMDDAGQAMARARIAVDEPTSVDEKALLRALDSLMGIRAMGETLALIIAGEALGRGLNDGGGLSAHDWLAARCPWLTRSEIGDVVVVARGVRRPEHAAIADVAANGGVPLRRLAKLLRTLERVAPVCDGDAYAASIDILLPVVTDPDFTDRDLKVAADHLIECALPEADSAAAVSAAREMRGVHESSLAGGSHTRFIFTCDQAGAALFRSIFASPLAAPAPDDATGVDERTAQQRRYDAAITVFERGMTSPEGSPMTSKAKIFVTMSYDGLRDALVGAGRTFTGETLTAGQVRQLACSAELIPTVLGSMSEVVDHGRATRLATPGQIKRLWLRDKGCTFPGCTIPATWCDAHHATWWSRHGATDLDNLALLCGRHHTRVHDLDLTATVTATGVTWHT